MGETCPRCGRPRGPILPKQDVRSCDMEDGFACRVAAAAYAHGLAVGRCGGIDEGVRLAKEQLAIKVAHNARGQWTGFGPDWTDVDKAAAAAKEATMSETCPRCGRPISTSWFCDIDECWPGEASCDVVAAYARGIASVAISLPSAEVLALLRRLVAERTGGVARVFVAAPWDRALDALDELDKAAAAAKEER